MLKQLGKVFGLLAISALFVGSVSAADMSAQRDEMIKSLNLTPEQKTQVETIMNDSHTQREAIMQKYADKTGPAKMKAMRPDMEKLHKETQDKLSKVLNDEQMMKVEEMQDTMLENAKAQMMMNQQAK